MLLLPLAISPHYHYTECGCIRGCIRLLYKTLRIRTIITINMVSLQKLIIQILWIEYQIDKRRGISSI